MVDKIKVGIFRKKVTKYKNITCKHADWVTFRSLAEKTRYTFAETFHQILTVYLKCINEKHERQIESLEAQHIILAGELKKYRDRFGVIKN